MAYKVNLPPFDAFGNVYSGSPIPAQAEIVETPETRPTLDGASALKASDPVHSTTLDEPYHQRVRDALRAIAALDYPPGTLAWAETAYPKLYPRMLTIPMEQVDKLWREHAPLDQFESVLTDWIEAHRTAGKLYDEYLAALVRREDSGAA